MYINKYVLLLLFSISLVGCETVKVIDKNVSECFKDITKCAGGQNNSSSKPKKPQGSGASKGVSQSSKISQYPKNIVEDVQRSLNSKGYHAGNVDGLYGSGTRTAVANFQRDNNISALGELNDQTLAKLGVDKTLPVKSRSKPQKKSKTEAQEPTNQSNGELESSHTPAPQVESQESDQEVQTGDEETTQYAITKLSGVNLQAEPNAFSSTKKILSQGERATVIEIQGDWTKVNAGGVEGFVYTDDLLFQ